MSEIQLNDPQTLYRRWEDQQWTPFAVDLSVDKEQWPALDPAIREIIYFALSSLMVAEERITTTFAGLVAAHAPEEETTFLATQQVDEARHMQFYARFRDEVIAEPQTIAAHVERAREEVSDSFRELFDGALVELHDELVASPGDLAAKVRFITLVVLPQALAGGRAWRPHYRCPCEARVRSSSAARASSERRARRSVRYLNPQAAAPWGARTASLNRQGREHDAEVRLREARSTFSSGAPQPMAMGRSTHPPTQSSRRCRSPSCRCPRM